MTLTTQEALTVALLILAAGKLIGWGKERLELRDWKEWRADMDTWREKHETGDSKRFDEASDRLSRLAGIVNALPTQIEDRIDSRIIGRKVAEAKFDALERRVLMLEERQISQNHRENRERERRV